MAPVTQPVAMTESPHKKYALFIGRWQPPHNGHVYIVKQALDAGKNVAIGFRDTPITDSDPYPIHTRIEMWRAIFNEMGISNDRYTFTSVPDIESVNIGRKVGYEVVRFDVPEEIAGISATAIRKGLASGDDSWQECVPDSVAQYLVQVEHGEMWRQLPGSNVIWLTGLPCSGKTTIASRIHLNANTGAKTVVILDGDITRQGMCSDLGFSQDDRKENLRRVAFMARLLADTGALVVCAYVSPLAEQRAMVKDIITKDRPGGRFHLVHVHATPEQCAERDVKGMWAQAKSGKIKEFTGYNSPYEDPNLSTEALMVNTEEESVAESAHKVGTYVWLRLRAAHATAQVGHSRPQAQTAGRPRAQ